MSLQNQYKKFTDTISLTRQDSGYKDAREKDDLIYGKIKAAFKEEKYDISETFLLGSMGVYTGIKPIDGDHDIDRAIVVTEESSPENPIDIKKVVKKVLKDHGFSDPKIKKPCITADYKSKPIHIDYVVFRIDDNADIELAVGKETSNEDNRKWDESDPKGLKSWLVWEGEGKSTEERAQYYRLVRIMKRWRDYKYTDVKKRKKVYSIGLAVMLKEKICFSIDENGKADDHLALRNTIDNILADSTYFKKDIFSTLLGEAKYDLIVNLPKSPNRDIFDNHGKTVGTTLRERLSKLRDILDEVTEQKDLKSQCEILEKSAFGNDFPIPSDNEKREQTDSSGVMSVSSGA